MEGGTDALALLPSGSLSPPRGFSGALNSSASDSDTALAGDAVASAATGGKLRVSRGLAERKSKAQQSALERAFAAQRNPRSHDLARIAAQVGLSFEVTARWFRNRRHRQADRVAPLAAPPQGPQPGAHAETATETAAHAEAAATGVGPVGAHRAARQPTRPATRGHVDDDVDQAWAKLWQMFAMPHAGKAAAAAPRTLVQLPVALHDDGTMRVPFTPILRSHARGADGPTDDEIGRQSREPVDPHLLDGLRRMFQRHRAYLLALAPDVMVMAPTDIRRPIPVRYSSTSTGTATPPPPPQAPAGAAASGWRPHGVGVPQVAVRPAGNVFNGGDDARAAGPLLPPPPPPPLPLPVSAMMAGAHAPSPAAALYAMYGVPVTYAPGISLGDRDTPGRRYNLA